ncbi:MAG: 4-alpha-glucanotransferase [Acidimicrobiales bacterium]
MATDAWGIEDGYWDIAGTWHEAPPDTRRALRVAMGGMAEFDDPPPRSRPVWFVRNGTGPPIERPAEVLLEDGSELRVTRALPPDLPLGYHNLLPSDGGPKTRLIVVPDRCHLPVDQRAWGWSTQLYATRSRDSWGIGDLADLRRLSDWSRSLGAGVVAINPLHTPLPFPQQDPSPYFPSSRRFLNPLYLRIEEVPGFDPDDPVLRDAAAAGRVLNAERRIDRDRVWSLKLAALEHLWSRFTADPAFDAYCDHQSVDLNRYAIFSTLAEEHGSEWRRWPSEYRRPDTPPVMRFAFAHADRVRFHEWLQWLLDEQLAAACEPLPVLADLAIGVDPGGADAWMWQEVLAPTIHVGAPPDEFNRQGQDWGFNPFVPWRLRATGYRPLVETFRAAMRHAGGLRIDHVMGLFRLFWIPPGGRPADGAYVRYPGTELLDIVALESVRAGSWIVGEDLGTVEDQVRRDLAERGVLSYRLVWFEPVPPEAFPRQALAAITTHDLPTIAGLWTGRDLDAQRQIGLEVNERAAEVLKERLARVAGAGVDAPVRDVVRGAFHRLARAPSMVVTASLDDALGVEERPNMPGTIDEWPNWRLALPETLAEIEGDENVGELAGVLNEGRRATGSAAGSAVGPPP